MRAQSMAESLLKKKPPVLSPETFEIIGHARYRQGDLGRAALWYQRAALFAGASPELRQNLRHLFERTRFLSFDEISPLQEWSLWLTPNQWVILAAGGVWLVFVSLAWRVLSGRRGAALPVVVAILGLMIAAPASAFAALRPAGAELLHGGHGHGRDGDPAAAWQPGAGAGKARCMVLRGNPQPGGQPARLGGRRGTDAAVDLGDEFGAVRAGGREGTCTLLACLRHAPLSKEVYRLSPGVALALAR